MSAPVLDIRGLSVTFPGTTGPVKVVDRVDLTLHRGETLGIVGESGSGKTMTGLSIMGLTPSPGVVTAEKLELLGRSMITMPESERRKLRGKDMGMVFQDPMSSLNPVRTIGSLLVEAIQRHNPMGKAEAQAKALAAIKAMGIPSPEERLFAYPHQLSGGLRQRVMIALALINHPALLIADEPTTALDATIQLQILDLLAKRKEDAATILVTHDFGAAAQICSQIAVMYHGRIVEAGPAADVLLRPRHRYTQTLLAAVPRFSAAKVPLKPIPGSPPRPDEQMTGCSFRARCSYSSMDCEVRPVSTGGTHSFACAHPAPAGGSA